MGAVRTAGRGREEEASVEGVSVDSGWKMSNEPPETAWTDTVGLEAMALVLKVSSRRVCTRESRFASHCTNTRQQLYG